MARELEFTAASFQRIATLEARRGQRDPGQKFPSVATVIRELKDVHKQRSDACSPLWRVDDVRARAVYGGFRVKIAELQRKKRQVLEAELNLVSTRFSAALKDDTFTWALKQGATRKSRLTYQISDEPERYFPMKQLEANLRNAYSLAAPNRNRLIAQLRDSLEGKLARYVLRTDISSFYDSIPHSLLLQALVDHGGLSATSMRLIRQLLKEWADLTGREVGLPVGVGLSAFLGEVFARKIDSSLSGDHTVHFYGRYVDDIVVVTRNLEDHESTRKALRKVVGRLGLKFNKSKTERHHPVPHTGPGADPYNFAKPVEFLGYALLKLGGNVSVDMSARTVDRYKSRLKASFDGWAGLASPTTGHDGLLLDRVRFLTGNTKLVNSKGRAVTGIYFNYPELSPGAACLVTLDDELSSLVSAHTASMSPRLLDRLGMASFASGFAERTYHRFRQSDLIRLVAVWRG